MQFTVTVEGSTPLTFQWQQNATNLTDGNGISGSSTPTLTLAGVSSASDWNLFGHSQQYFWFGQQHGRRAGHGRSGHHGGDVSADGPPIIASQPTNQIAPQGGAATFSVLSAGALPLFYQWQFNGVNITNATNATLTLENLKTSQTGSYAVAISNPQGSTVSSNALLTVLPGVQELITFDDLPYRILPVPEAYENLNWSNFFYLNGIVSRLSGYRTRR